MLEIFWPSIFILLIPILIFISIIVFIIGVVRRTERRADERLKIDKENAYWLQQQMQEINIRLTNIERTLKEVD
ncbi:hypothetical protein RE628_11675 [Paenibacillus sp. D2_2]|uniref:hypothetical protein n=1 Tax=Paenibacillus sp. D2_2 TaxID=3073092 RepID=UPI002816029E|nr:hypothetical protein [Paenibacillus sp. D2_2]WMT42882.1 hypothetical protein RE628_11675 [Paenibacillus sp. D2_2]